MDQCDLHTILRLPQGIFYSAGVQTNVLFFTKGKTDTGNTKTVSYYDMRSGAPRYGRNRPLSEEDFSDFERTYNTRHDLSNLENERWRSFTREEIASRDDDLNISWLQSADLLADEVSPDPLAILATMVDHLRLALDEAEGLSEELALLITSAEEGV